MGVDGQASAGAQGPGRGESAAFALGAKAQVFELDQHRWRETVVELGEVHVLGSQAGHGIGALARLFRRGSGQIVRRADVLVAMSLADAEQVDRAPGQVAGALGAGHDHGRAAIGDQRAIEQAQGIGDGPGGQHIVHRDRFAHLGAGIERGVGARGHGDFRKLLGGGAELVGMRLGDQRVVSRHGGAVGLLELGVPARRLHQHGLLAAQSRAQRIGHGDQHDLGHTGDDRRGRVVQDGKRRAAAGAHGHAVAGENLQVLGERLGVVEHGLGHGIAGHHAVHIALVKTGIGERPQRRLHAQLHGRAAGNQAHRGFRRAHQRHLAAQPLSHETPPRPCPGQSPGRLHCARKRALVRCAARDRWRGPHRRRAGSRRCRRRCGWSTR